MNGLIVARPGLLREGLSGLLSTLPEIKVVAVTASLESALESVAQCCPSIVLLETYALDAEYLAQLQALKALCPRTRIIALAKDLKEAQVCDEGGVDVALTEGVPPARLGEIISGLLRSPTVMLPKT